MPHADLLPALLTAEDGLRLVAQLSVAAMLGSLVVGLLVGLIQSVTQIQDPALANVPKIIVTLAVLWFLGPWMMSQVLDYANANMEKVARISEYGE